MSMTVDVSRLREQLSELLDHAVQAGEVCLIEQNGKPYAVLVSAREWRRRTVGKQLDALGASYRLTKENQRRTEELLAESKTRSLTRAERRELNSLLRESEQVMLRRAKALGHR